MNHFRIKIAPDSPASQQLCLYEYPAGATERIEYCVTRLNAGDVHKCPRHTGHHHTRVEKIPLSRVPEIEFATVERVQYPAEITPVTGENGAIFCFRIFQADRTGDHGA